MRILKIVEPYSGSKEEDVRAWLKKVDVAEKAQVRQTQAAPGLAQIIPLLLKRPAFVVWDGLGATEKQDIKEIKRALINAFGPDEYDSFDTLRSRKYEAGESVEAYLADLRRLTEASGLNQNEKLPDGQLPGAPWATCRAGVGDALQQNVVQVEDNRGH